jgi:hypothetical protein
VLHRPTPRNDAATWSLRPSHVHPPRSGRWLRTWWSRPDGDPEAVRLTDTAVAHLVTAAVAAAGDGVPTRVVLAGSLLVADGPVRAGVVTALRARWPSTTITLGTDGAAGAAALALRRVTGRPLEAAVHQRLCGPRRLAP